MKEEVFLTLPHSFAQVTVEETDEQVEDGALVYEELPEQVSELESVSIQTVISSTDDVGNESERVQFIQQSNEVAAQSQLDNETVQSAESQPCVVQQTSAGQQHQLAASGGVPVSDVSSSALTQGYVMATQTSSPTVLPVYVQSEKAVTGQQQFQLKPKTQYVQQAKQPQVSQVAKQQIQVLQQGKQQPQRLIQPVKQKPSLLLQQAKQQVLQTGKSQLQPLHQVKQQALQQVKQPTVQPVKQQMVPQPQVLQKQELEVQSQAAPRQQPQLLQQVKQQQAVQQVNQPLQVAVQTNQQPQVIQQVTQPSQVTQQASQQLSKVQSPAAQMVKQPALVIQQLQAPAARVPVPVNQQSPVTSPMKQQLQLPAVRLPMPAMNQQSAVMQPANQQLEVTPARLGGQAVNQASEVIQRVKLKEIPGQRHIDFGRSPASVLQKFQPGGLKLTVPDPGKKRRTPNITRRNRLPKHNLNSRVPAQHALGPLPSTDNLNLPPSKCDELMQQLKTDAVSDSTPQEQATPARGATPGTSWAVQGQVVTSYRENSSVEPQPLDTDEESQQSTPVVHLRLETPGAVVR